MLRIVLDTNVLISALAFQGETKRIWELAEKKEFELFISAFILLEIESNLLRLVPRRPVVQEPALSKRTVCGLGLSGQTLRDLQNRFRATVMSRDVRPATTR